MKLIKKEKENLKVIDSEKEHNEVLFQLGILDDMEDWQLYQRQEDRFMETLIELGNEEYKKYLKTKK